MEFRLPNFPGYAVWFTSMNSGLFGESILLIFSGSNWARDNRKTNFCILISRAFAWTYHIFSPINATADKRQKKNYSDQRNSWQKTKHDFGSFIWPICNFFADEKILKFFSTKYLHLGSCFESWGDISILVQKTATRA